MTFRLLETNLNFLINWKIKWNNTIVCHFEEYVKNLFYSPNISSTLKGVQITNLVKSSFLIPKTNHPIIIKRRGYNKCSQYTAKNNLLFRSNNRPVLAVRHFNEWIKQRAEHLQRSADSNPRDPIAQYTFLDYVVEIDPGYVMKRVEGGRYAIDERVLNVYLKANERLNPQSTMTSYSSPTRDSNDRGMGNLIRDLVLRSLSTTLTMLCIVIIFFALWRPFESKNGMDIGSILGDKNDSQEIQTETVTTRFSDVKGSAETKEELLEVVDFLKSPQKYQRIGGRISNGVLLIGPPGTGKTLLARAIAGEANVPFFYATGSEFDEVFVGVGASRIRKLFDKARKQSPCIIFIDELDAVGSKRRDNDMNPYGRMTLNQLLTEMDGFKDKAVVVIGATNAPNVLDPALVRAGRFDTHIYVPLPCFNDRVEIIDYYLDKVTRSSDISVKRLAALTPGASGADLSNLVNQAAIHAVNVNSKIVSMEHLEYSRDKILMGRERKALIFTEDEKRRIAFHEAGHAVVAFYTKGARKLHKATIIPRGSSLGVTHLIPDKDEYLVSYQQLVADIDVSMGGRAAEELIYGKDQITTGCGSDLTNATSIAKKMVSECGFSRRIGFTSLDYVKSQPNASDLDELVQTEIKKILDESYNRVLELLKNKSKEHKALADALCKYEILDEVQMKEILA